MLTKARVLKALGVAGLTGVAATGVIIARDQRKRSTMGPDEVRARLHERVAAAQQASSEDGGSGERAR